MGGHTAMASELEELHNYPKLFVTRKCCGAMNCRNFAPQLLAEVPPLGEPSPAYRLLPGTYEPGAFTGVIKQPSNPEEYDAARAAVRACAFNALQLRGHRPATVPSVKASALHPRELDDGVWMMGAADTTDKNFGAMTYFIQRPDGNVLVDPPRPSEALFEFIEQRGGLRWLFITHKDHAAGHSEIAARMGCRRVIGAADVNLKETQYEAYSGDCEVQVASRPGVFDLEGRPLRSVRDAELAVLTTPGHTPGGLCLAYKNRFLFTGDHLSFSQRTGRLTAHRIQCWEDWDRLMDSNCKLLERMRSKELAFVWVLPGHGELHRFESEEAATAALEACLGWMARTTRGHQNLFPGYVLWATSRAMAPQSAVGCFLRLVGGPRAKESWVLNDGSLKLLPDYDPAAVAAARIRAYLLLSSLPVALAASISLVAWRR